MVVVIVLVKQKVIQLKLSGSVRKTLQNWSFLYILLAYINSQTVHGCLWMSFFFFLRESTRAVWDFLSHTAIQILYRYTDPV